MIPEVLFYEFDNFRLDVKSEKLIENGEPVQLTHKAFEILLILVQNTEQTVKKEDIIERLWADTFVEESNITQYVYTLRKTLGAHQPDKNYIDTIPRLGYRFTGTVTAVCENIAATEAESGAELLFPRSLNGNGSTPISVTSDAGTDKIELGNVNHESPGSVSGIRFAVFATAGFILLLGMTVAVVFLWQRLAPPVRAAFSKTEAQRAGSDGKVRLSTISPDGKYIAYVSGEFGTRSVDVRELDTGNVITVVPSTPKDIGGITFSPNGESIYYTQLDKSRIIRSLYQVSKLGGISKKVIEDVGTSASFSPNGRQVAFVRYVWETGEAILMTAGADGSNAHPIYRTTQTDFNFLMIPVWSPDGTKIVVAGVRSSAGATVAIDLLAISVNDGTSKPIGKGNWNSINSLAWLSDGSGLLIAAREREAAPTQIWRVAFPSGEAKAITNDLNDYSGVSLSADDTTIITIKSDVISSLARWENGAKESEQLIAESPNLEGFSGIAEGPDGRVIFTRVDGADTNLWAMDSSGQNKRQLTTGVRLNHEPAVTPDGRYIVFSSNRTGTWRLWRMDADGKNPVQLTADNNPGADFMPQITADGTTIIFQRIYSGTRQSTDSMKVSIDGGDGGDPGPVLSDDAHANYFPQLSPDNKYIAYASYDLSTRLKKLQIDEFTNGAAGKPVRNFDYNLINKFSWSPDGKSFTYLSPDSEPNLWKLPIDGTTPGPITDFKSGRIFNFAWSHDGVHLLIVRGIVNNDLVLIQDTEKRGQAAGRN